MDYYTRFVSEAAKAILWRGSTVAVAAQYLVAFGVSLLFGFSRWDQAQPMLNQLGLTFLSDLSAWAYLAFGLAAMILAMAVRVATLNTRRIEFGAIRLNNNQLSPGVILPIRQCHWEPVPCRVVADFSPIGDGVAFQRVLQSRSRIEADKKSTERHYIDDEFKDFEIFRYSRFGDTSIVVQHADGETDAGMRCFRIKVSVVGCGPVATKDLTFCVVNGNLWVSDGERSLEFS